MDSRTAKDIEQGVHKILHDIYPEFEGLVTSWISEEGVAVVIGEATIYLPADCPLYDVLYLAGVNSETAENELYHFVVEPLLKLEGF